MARMKLIAAAALTLALGAPLLAQQWQMPPAEDAPNAAPQAQDPLTTPGDNSDGTNTRLDDGITLVRNNVTLSGAEKQRYLAWKGWKNASGVRVDDSGSPIPATRGGEFRPQPILLPLR